MYCENCGRQLPDKAKFCAYCGAEQQTIVIKPAEAAESEPVSEPAAIPVSEPIAVPVAEPVSEPIAVAVSAPEQTASSVLPVSNPIPTSNISESQQMIQSIQSPQTGVVTPVITLTENPNKAEDESKRKYTGGALAMCLIAAGVCAAAAGVFAGLYFFG